MRGAGRGGWLNLGRCGDGKGNEPGNRWHLSRMFAVAGRSSYLSSKPSQSKEPPLTETTFRDQMIFGLC